MASAVTGRAGPWRHVPNALSALRIACAPVLLLLAAAGQQAAYTWVLVPALLTDAVDGWIARAFAVQSPLGARLDSLGDTLLWCGGIAGLVAFQRELLAAHVWLVGAACSAWLLEHVLAWLRYGRLSSFHTRLSKLAGVLLGVCIGVTFVLGPLDGLLQVAAFASLCASCEELWLLALLPRWQADVPGVWWLRRAG